MLNTEDNENVRWNIIIINNNNNDDTSETVIKSHNRFSVTFSIQAYYSTNSGRDLGRVQLSL